MREHTPCRKQGAQKTTICRGGKTVLGGVSSSVFKQAQYVLCASRRLRNESRAAKCEYAGFARHKRAFQVGKCLGF